jgi:hypothetical protein
MKRNMNTCDIKQSVMDRQETLMLDAGVSPDKAGEAYRQNKTPYEKWAQSRPPDGSTDNRVIIKHKNTIICLAAILFLLLSISLW